MSETAAAMAEALNQVEENPYAGMSFGDVFGDILSEQPSSDPGVQAFEATMNAIEAVYQHFNVPFDREEYWNRGVIEGSFPVFPEVVKPLEIPENITEEDILRFAEFSRSLNELTARIRSIQMNRGAAPRSQTSTIDGRMLERQVQVAPMYVRLVEDTEDDFL